MKIILSFVDICGFVENMHMHYNTIYCQIYFGIYWISHSGWNIMLTAGEKYVVNNAICVYHAAGFLEKKKKKCVK